MMPVIETDRTIIHFTKLRGGVWYVIAGANNAISGQLYDEDYYKVLQMKPILALKYLLKI